jgi:hypothetical protein
LRFFAILFLKAADRVRRLRKSADYVWKTLIAEVLRQPA